MSRVSWGERKQQFGEKGPIRCSGTAKCWLLLPTMGTWRLQEERKRETELLELSNLCLEFRESDSQTFPLRADITPLI